MQITNKSGKNAPTQIVSFKRNYEGEMFAEIFLGKF